MNEDQHSDSDRDHSENEHEPIDSPLHKKLEFERLQFPESVEKKAKKRNSLNPNTFHLNDISGASRIKQLQHNRPSIASSNTSKYLPPRSDRMSEHDIDEGSIGSFSHSYRSFNDKLPKSNKRLNLDFIKHDLNNAPDETNNTIEDHYEINMDTGSSNKNPKYKRIYYAKYTIPPPESKVNIAMQSAQIMVGSNLKKQQKNLRNYKKFSNVFTTALMGLSSLLLLILYIYQITKLSEERYFITRARVTITETQDGETLTVNKLMYFLYRNTTSGAKNAFDGGNQLIVSDLESICGNTQNGTVPMYALFPDQDTVTRIHYNIDSAYMYASTAFTFLLMSAVALFNTVYISFYMKEHHIPLIFRYPDSSVYHDTQRAKNFFFMIFIVLAGIMVQLNFYVVSDKCLHTIDESGMPSNTVDTYQYALMALLWIVAIPVLVLLALVGFRDNLKIGCYPVVIINIIFAFMLFILTQIVLIYAIIYAENVLLKILHIANYCILGVSLVNTAFYRVKYAKIEMQQDHDKETGENAQ